MNYRLPNFRILPRVAVVGSGISGLAAAWLLSERYEVTLFEANDYLGGHTNTVEVEVEGFRQAVDTGFLVFNDRTYPNLVALFDHLGVESVASEMSFSVSLEQPALEWAGSSLATVFGQKRNLLRPDFWRMLVDILRFNGASQEWLRHYSGEETSLGEYLQEHGYSQAFAHWYLLPMAAAIWSSPAGKILDMPLATFVRFCRNHGLLQLVDRPVWRTVKGGGREYVRRLAADIDDIRLATPVERVVSLSDGALVIAGGRSEKFSRVVLACHADQALALLGDAASREQTQILSALRYAPNRAVLHTDAGLLPCDRKLWSAWNYQAAGISATGGMAPVSVSYLLNRLQPLPFATPVVVTLNPVREPAPDKIIAEFDYAHPLFDGPAIAAQRRIERLQGVGNLWFCGAWGGYGFHEDGLASALRVANGLGVMAPWQKDTVPAPAAQETAVV